VKRAKKFYRTTGLKFSKKLMVSIDMEAEFMSPKKPENSRVQGPSAENLDESCRDIFCSESNEMSKDSIESQQDICLEP
jgi:hypothetical protein